MTNTGVYLLLPLILSASISSAMMLLGPLGEFSTGHYMVTETLCRTYI